MAADPVAQSQTGQLGRPQRNIRLAQRLRASIAQRRSYKESTMYTRLLIPLDGSKTSETVLPYARFLAGRLKLPVELLQVVDVAEIGRRISPDKAEFLNEILANVLRRAADYLNEAARTLGDVNVTCTVEKGAAAAEFIIEKAAQDPGTLINMATHGYSGFKRWLLGSVAEKVLRGARNPLFLVRATEQVKRDEEATLRIVIVPLDGSALAEKVLAPVAELAKRMKLEVILFRAYTLPASALAADAEAYYLVSDEKLIAALHEEAAAYLEKKAQAMKEMGVEKVSCLAQYGFAADQIISLGRKTPDNLIAMCTHGQSGVKRWVLGSVTETVVRHSGDPVLVIRAAG
jgi:nucleotide-binding universal stress UspA family protein